MPYVGVKPAGITSATEAEIAGDLTVDTSTLIVDSANNNVGIGSTSPQAAKFGGSLNPIVEVKGTKPVLSLTETDVSNSESAIGLAGGDTYITNTGGAKIIFATGASSWTERARITDNGLTFNGDTAAANALSDYEEGNFTPSVTDTSGNTGSASEATGYYRKIGGLVHVELRLTNINTSGLTSTDDVRVASLPFTHSSRTGSVQAIIGDIYHNHINLDHTGVLLGILGEGNDYFVIVETKDSAGDHDILVSDLNSGSADLLISFAYHTEQ